MDEHQRRLWTQMADEVAGYRAGRVTLRKLVQNLEGLLGAADIHDQRFIDEFWTYQAPIYGEMLLRTEDWAPPGAASDDRLEDTLSDFVAWVQSVLSSTDDART